MIFFVVFYCCILTLADGATIKETDSVEDIEPKDFPEIILYEDEEPKSSRPALPRKNLNAYAIPHELTPSGHQLWEGDLILSSEEVHELYGPSYRKAINDFRKRWPAGIIYYRLLNSSEPDREVINSAIKHWMDNTCLKFYEVDDNFRGNHIYFNKSEGCYSKVGMMNSINGQAGMNTEINGQIVSIGKGCAHMGKVAHEIGHAIGFRHEQSRPNRDQYIRVINKNIKPKKIWNFVIHRNVLNYGIQYDLTSLMHYGLLSFSSNGKKTIVPLDTSKEFLIGQRNGLSFSDIKMANIMYKCADRCKEKPHCYNDGFVNHKCECICPPEFKGRDCNVPVKPSKKTCGGNFTSEFLSSPNYPENYPKNTTCIWIIKAPAEKKIKLIFHNFDLYKPSKDDTCKKDYLEVRIKNNNDGNKYCGNQLRRKKLLLQSDEAVLAFKATEDQNKGFYLNVEYI